ncbi:MAG: hypothetical protein V3V41_07915 [Candidatus Heimdallarchaeota archaeon]
MSREVPYDYALLYKWRQVFKDKPNPHFKSWPEIGKYYGKAHTTVMRWYKTQSILRDQRRTAKVHSDTPKRSIPKKRKIHTKPIIQIDNHTDITVDEIIKWAYINCPMIWKWKPLPAYIRRFMIDVWERTDTLVIYPRDHGKTIALCVLFLYWVLELNKSVLVIAGLPYKIWYIMKRVMEHQDIQDTYGFDIIKKNETTGIIYTSRQICEDPIIRVCAWGSSYVGSHFDWTHLEDIIQQPAVAEASNERIYDNFNDNVRDISHRLSISGTRKAIDDLYAYLKKHYFIEIKEEAIKLKGRWPTKKDFIFGEYVGGDGLTQIQPIAVKQSYYDEVEITMLNCPKWTLDKLLIRYFKNPDSFHSQFMNDPRPSKGKYFDADQFNTVNSIPDDKYKFVYYLIMDPARGMTEGADRTSILVIGIYNGIAYIVDGYTGRIDDDKKVEKINEFYKKYNPANTVIEATFAQIDMNKFAHIRGLEPYYDTATKAKIVRISACKSYWKDKLIRVLEDIQPYTQLYDEYILYNEKPSDRSRKDDNIDVVSMFIQKYGHFLSTGYVKLIDYSQTKNFAIGYD